MTSANNVNVSKQLVIRIYARKPPKGDLKEITSVDAYHFSVGSALGDGYVHKKDFSIAFEQRSPSFILWKRSLCIKWQLLYDKPDFSFTQMFPVLVPSNIPLRAKTVMKWREVDGKMVKRKDRTFYFATRSLYSTPAWRDLFYQRLAVPVTDARGRMKEYRKKVPHNIKDYFWGDLALAIFFFDDGWYDWEKETVRFSAGEWPRDECEILVECLRTNFNLESVIYPLTGDPHHFFVKKTHYPEFYRRVLPFYLQFREAFPHYDANTAMKNKVLPLPQEQKD